MQLPDSFADYTRALMGDEEYDRLSASLLEAEPPVSIRLNLRKCGDASSFLPPSSFSEVPWASGAYYLDRRPPFTFDPLFHAGCYYVQEASSMFLEQALRRYLPARPLAALDLCAAPGGKSTHLRSLLPSGSLLVANEVIRNRAQILAENLTKWGHPDVVVTGSDPAAFTPLDSFFDFILTDVPCSGEGMFRKDETAVGEWSPKNVEVCWQRQRRILTDIWPCLKPGGLLVYSTCTYNIKEDEEQVRWMCDEWGAEPLSVADVPASWGITGNLLEDEDFPVYRFLPHRVKGEGLFVCVLQKPDEKLQTATPSATRRRQPATKVPQAAAQWLTGDYNYSLNGDTLTAIGATITTDADYVARCANVLLRGVELGSMKGRDIVPAQSLALTTAANRGAFAHADVDYATAIAYLRGDAITLGDVPRGTVLVEYQGAPLGFAKQVGNRANNLYPRQWRIRSTYAPTTPPCILCQQ